MVKLRDDVCLNHRLGMDERGCTKEASKGKTEKPQGLIGCGRRWILVSALGGSRWKGGVAGPSLDSLSLWPLCRMQVQRAGAVAGREKDSHEMIADTQGGEVGPLLEFCILVSEAWENEELFMEETEEEKGRRVGHRNQGLVQKGHK